MGQALELEAVPAHKIGDIQLAKRAMKVLCDHYPGFIWQVRINDEELGGIMTILNLTINEQIFDNNSWGYVLYLSNVYQDPNLKCVVRAGGEILERAYLARGKHRDGEEVVKVDGIPDKNQPLKIIH